MFRYYLNYRNHDHDNYQVMIRYHQYFQKLVPMTMGSYFSTTRRVRSLCNVNPILISTLKRASIEFYESRFHFSPRPTLHHPHHPSEIHAHRNSLSATACIPLPFTSCRIKNWSKALFPLRHTPSYDIWRKLIRMRVARGLHSGT